MEGFTQGGVCPRIIFVIFSSCYLNEVKQTSDMNHHVFDFLHIIFFSLGISHNIFRIRIIMSPEALSLSQIYAWWPRIKVIWASSPPAYSMDPIYFFSLDFWRIPNLWRISPTSSNWCGHRKWSWHDCKQASGRWCPCGMYTWASKYNNFPRPLEHGFWIWEIMLWPSPINISLK